MTPRGGKRKGAGRHRLSKERRIAVGLSLPPSVVVALDREAARAEMSRSQKAAALLTRALSLAKRARRRKKAR